MKEQHMCLYCGKTFTPQRSTAKFCPDSDCRVKYHREKKRAISAPFEKAAELINAIGNAANDPEMSYEATEALLSLRAILNYNTLADSSSWWHCRKCGRNVRKELPLEDDCQCQKPQWILTKRMI